MPPDGRFAWLRRMGVHEAYHRSGVNRAFHWLCIPVELFALLLVLGLPRWGALDLGMAAIAAAGAIYLACDLVAGALMIALLAGLHAAARAAASGAPLRDAALGTLLFGVSFLVQTKVGHRVFERGVDDTAMNVAELRRTRNPIPIVLIFYYHLVEVLFAAGYRPALRARMEAARDAELARIRQHANP